MGIFDDLSPDTAALLSAGGAMATPPTRVPVPFSYSLSQGLAAIPQGVATARALQGQNMQNQMQRLNLERQQAMQPAMLNMIKNGFGSPSGTPNNGSASGGSPADAQFAQAYQLAMMSGDMGKAATVLQSWAEHNPAQRCER